MEKTAMQIAIEWVNDNYPKFNHHEIEEKLTELRDTVEKEQIKCHFIAGMEFIPVDPNKYQEDAEDFYNQTYKP